MKHFLIAITVVSFPVLALAQDSPPPKQADTEAGTQTEVALNGDPFSHDGVWKPIAAVLSGKRLPDEAVKAITLKISGKNYEVIVEGEDHVDKGVVTRDTTTSPKRITIKGTDGPNKGKTILGIYEMKNSYSIRICYDMSGKDFPKDFRAPKGTQLYLAGYRRQKTDAAKTTPKQ